MNKHICILWCFKNVEHIIQCFTSIYRPETDYFIVENKSEKSDLIKDFFLRQRLAGYIQFEENIADNAVRLFLNDFEPLLRKYEYITFSDGDLLADNAESLFSEIFRILRHPEVGICTADLKLFNFPHHLAKPHEWLPLPTGATNEYIECPTGAHFMTMKIGNLPILTTPAKSIDGSFRYQCALMGLKWAKTRFNKVKHLTWDYYVQGHEYYEFRKKNPQIFNQTKTCNYKQLI